MDRLPRAMAARVKGPIELGAKVLDIESRDDGKVELTLSRAGGPPVVEVHPEVRCTLPFGVLQNMDNRSFSAEKQQAIRQTNDGSATKVLLNTQRRFWAAGVPVASPPRNPARRVALARSRRAASSFFAVRSEACADGGWARGTGSSSSVSRCATTLARKRAFRSDRGVVGVGRRSGSS